MTFKDEFAAAGEQVAFEMRARQEAAAGAVARQQEKHADAREQFASFIEQNLAQQSVPVQETGEDLANEFSAFIRAQH